MDPRIMKQVLEMAVQSEQHSGRQVLNAQAEISRFEAKQKEFELYRQENEARIRHSENRAINSDYLAEYERFKGALDDVIDQHASMALSSEEHAEVLRARWQLTHQRKRALQQLVETKEISARRDLSRREQSQMEESLSGSDRSGH